MLGPDGDDEPRVAGYEVDGVLGKGGTGRVFRARRLADGRVVALKVLHPGALFESRARMQFEREVAAIGSLDHAGIAAIVDVDPSGEGRWLATEYVEGRSLAAELADHRRLAAGEPTALPVADWLLPPPSDRDHVPAVVRRLRGVAEALAHAHDRGVLHRDVKPGNILLASDGRTVLVDFGLSKLVDQASRSSIGDLMGTLHYMSPEQVLAKRVPIGPATDLWSLGVVLYEALCGTRPFDADETRELHRQICFEEPVPLRRRNPRIPRSLAALVEACLHKNPKDRPASAADVVRCLDAFLAYEHLPLPRLPLRRRLAGVLRRHRRLATTVAAAAVVVGVFTLSSSLAEARERNRSYEEAALALRKDRALATEPGLAGVGLPELVAVQDRARTARADPRLAEDASDLLTRLEAEGKRAHTEGRELLAASVVPDIGDPMAPRLPDPEGLARGERLLRRAGQLLHGQESHYDREYHDLTDCRVRLRVEGVPAGIEVRVWAFLLDPWTRNVGEPVIERANPAAELRLQPGYYRVIVAAQGHGLGEYSRLLQNPGERCEIQAPIRKRDDVVADMVRFQRGYYSVGAPDKKGVSLIDAGRRVELWGFWIDRCEVTNRQFIQFMDATGHPAPKGWPVEWERYRERLLGEWAELPVCYVTWTQARAYAEWAGKRLPMDLEWEVAYGGPQSRFRIWAEDDAPSDRRLSHGFGIDCRIEDKKGLDPFELAQSFAFPVGTNAKDVTVEGVHDMLGNVQEWTEALALGLRFGGTAGTVTAPVGIAINEADRIVKGLHAGFDTKRFDVVMQSRRDRLWSHMASGQSRSIGFRCARTAFSR
ncbi:MAG: bifunctional serine/threonine-protein kinase/formylglycine-generating enzyme family protein [Planctomycetota bacterium]